MNGQERAPSESQIMTQLDKVQKQVIELKIRLQPVLIAEKPAEEELAKELTRCPALDAIRRIDDLLAEIHKSLLI